MPHDPQPLDLDAIEARANAATPGPWGTYQYGGDSLIEIAADLEETGCGYRARRTIARFDEEPLDNDPGHREWTAEEDWAQVQADAAYVTTLHPETAKAMAAEIRRLRAELATEQAQHATTLRQRNNRSERLLHLRDLANARDTEALIAAAQDTLAASVNDHKDDEGMSGPCDCGEGAVHYTAADCPAAQRAAAVVAHVVADDSDDPEHAARP
ncbi:hypothetical protein [Streptomyces sp. NPDC017086]|uniref:hypothetical protein n=1 Tax=Streptomyces sp. NPDC017086 TaxID=3364976 RepID=UPI0037AA6993